MRKPKLIDLNDAVQHPGRHVSYEVETSLEEEEDLDLLEPIRGTIDAVSTGNMLLVKGDFDARVVLECSRCLAPVQLDVSLKVDEEFPVAGVPSGYGNREYAEVKESEDEPSQIFEGNQLRYEDLLRQSLWLNLPMQPLCKEACQGLPEGKTAEREGRPEFEALGKLLDDDIGDRS